MVCNVNIYPWGMTRIVLDLKFIFINCLGILPGELSSKVVARCFWHCEVEEELAALGLQEQWTFSNEPGLLTGDYDQAMEFIDKNRCDYIYTHTCSEHCKSKGNYSFFYIGK